MAKEEDKARARELLLSSLPNFNGTDEWHRHAIVRDLLYTDGVHFVAEIAGAYWLIDEIAFLNKYKTDVRNEEFQVWALTVQDSQGVLSCEDGNGRVVFSKKIQFTDFPLDEIKFYYETNVLMLPSER